MRLLSFISLAVSLVMAHVTATAAPPAPPPPTPPNMVFLYRMNVELGQRFSLGPVPAGQERIVIPIVGGTFKGPRLAGKILNLGADWRLTDTTGSFRPEAHYNLQTEDGTYIYIQTSGPTQGDGRTFLHAKFETAVNGTHAWLNNVVAVGELTRSQDAVTIDMWSFEPAVAKSVPS